MNTTSINPPVRLELFMQVVDFLRAVGDTRDPVTAVNDAIQYWLDNASWKEDLISRSEQGYQWKELFLPHGTKLRMRYKGEYRYATVEGDDLIYEGEPHSPSELTRAITKTSRNAWLDIQVLRPGDRQWTLADDLRSKA